MDILHIDIETFSSIDLVKSGVYAYASALDFKILLFGYAFNDEDVKVIDLVCGEELPERVKKALVCKDVIKTAYNANFERVCIQQYFNIKLNISEWRCSAVAASELGLPQNLKDVAAMLKLDEQKDDRGKALIRYFCIPCKPTMRNNQRTVNLPEHDMEKWLIFKDYCKKDVEVERAIRKKILKFPIAESEQKLWEYDQKINDRGVKVDLDFVNKAIEFNAIYSNRCFNEAVTLTELSNPNSVAQLKNWIYENTGYEINSLNKETVKDLLSCTDDKKLKLLLNLRKQMSKTSISKYEAVLRSVCPDNRIRGLLQFYGANRTGRWAGRIVQVHNLPQNHLKDLDYARETVKSGDFEAFEILFGDVPSVLSELIRTLFIADKGRRFIVSDFSAIEARIIAYLADEQWRLDVFKTHGKIYEASASQMFKVPIEEIKKGNPLRQKGKIAELALGYGGSVGALKSMGALKMGLTEEELEPLVYKWRNSNKNIIRLWKTVEKAAINAVNDKPSIIAHGISFIKKSGILFVGLPSGRSIAYVKPKIERNKYGNMALTYEGIDQTKKIWKRIDTFGGKLTENIVQAFARDCLAESIIKLEKKGYEINFHVHDEIIINAPYGFSSAEEVAKIMSEPIEWAKGLPLNAEAYETEFYKKD